jgi:hypothetical protein
MPSLRERRHDFVGLLLATDTSPATNGSRNKEDEHHREGGDIFAALGKTNIPRPSKGDGFGDLVSFRIRASDATEVDAGMLFNFGQKSEKNCLFRIWVSGIATSTGYLHHKNDLQLWPLLWERPCRLNTNRSRTMRKPQTP